MFGNRRPLITVTPTQSEALFLYATHYNVLKALMTMNWPDIERAIKDGYRTEVDGNDSR